MQSSYLLCEVHRQLTILNIYAIVCFATPWWRKHLLSPAAEEPEDTASPLLAFSDDSIKVTRPDF